MCCMDAAYRGGQESARCLPPVFALSGWIPQERANWRYKSSVQRCARDNQLPTYQNNLPQVPTLVLEGPYPTGQNPSFAAPHVWVVSRERAPGGWPTPEALGEPPPAEPMCTRGCTTNSSTTKMVLPTGWRSRTHTLGSARRRRWTDGILESRKGRKKSSRRDEAKIISNRSFATNERLPYRYSPVGEIPPLTQQQQ